jgi:UDP-4-amino-4,6-dideoxy-N-acetyl-beta-L-altrosamine N-acetyltransferase
MEKQDLDLVLEWRNKPEIRMNMYTSHVISREEHYAWFERVALDSTKRYFICMADETPVGVVGFVDIMETAKTASWAFYSGDLSRRGIGSQMEYLALNYAFDELGLEKLNCEVLDFNQAVIKLHRKFGFEIEGIFKAQHYDGEKYHDIYRLAMFRKDWQRHLKSAFHEQLILGIKGDRQAIRAGSTYVEEFSLSQEDIQRFSQVTGDSNPIHFDEKAAKEAGFPGVIVPGFLTASIFSKILGTKFPGYGTIYLRQDLEFKKPAQLDQPLKAQLTVVTKKGRRLIIHTAVFDEKNDLIVDGEAEIFMPKKA